MESAARLTSLSGEILETIRDCFFDKIFGPKKLQSFEVDTPDMMLFLVMKRRSYGKHHRVFLSENTWSISPGGADKSIKFLARLPRAMY